MALTTKVATNIFRSTVSWTRKELQKTRSMHGKTLSRKNKGLLHIPIDKTRTNFERIFCINGAPGRKTRRSIQFPSVGWVLGSPQHFRSKILLSSWCRKPNAKSRAQREQNGRKWWPSVSIQSDLIGNKRWRMVGKTLLFITKYWVILDLGAWLK